MFDAVFSLCKLTGLHSEIWFPIKLYRRNFCFLLTLNVSSCYIRANVGKQLLDTLCIRGLQTLA